MNHVKTLVHQIRLSHAANGQPTPASDPVAPAPAPDADADADEAIVTTEDDGQPGEWVDQGEAVEYLDLSIAVQGPQMPGIIKPLFGIEANGLLNAIQVSLHSSEYIGRLR